MTNEMNSTEYIKSPKTFKFSNDDRQMLASFIPKEETKEIAPKLSAALNSIESYIRSYELDLRTNKRPTPPQIIGILRDCSLETKKVSEAFEILCNNQNDLPSIRLYSATLKKLSQELDSYNALLQVTSENIYPKRKKGKPQNEHLHKLAIDVASSLTQSGLLITKGRDALFFKVYAQVCAILYLKDVDTRYTDRAFDDLKQAQTK